ncbi:hypothetical protein SS50377_20614 [Spironucleus salmonicida]|uniref:Uncharacterized protein n=1 Tax=Spironucleus salmonicida TaxID=348837 RepID=A0A9P8LZG3_9EUKA|nr:hypothetical protein SS50377_20614 [Spironucleus salmonicida]
MQESLQILRNSQLQLMQDSVQNIIPLIPDLSVNEHQDTGEMPKFDERFVVEKSDLLVKQIDSVTSKIRDLGEICDQIISETIWE